MIVARSAGCEIKFTLSGPRDKLLLISWVYSETCEYSLFSYQLSIFTPTHLKMKFAFCDPIRQLPVAWHIYSES
jgi:hypothetical protein